MDEFREVTKMIMSEIDKDINVPNKNDSISREAVLDEIHKYMEERDYTIGTLYDNICEMPSARQWIPCSERLPEYDAPALLSTAWGKTEIGWWTQRGWVIVPASYRELKQDAVVAWMPLPEPYRGDEK